MEEREKLLSFLSYLLGWISGLIVLLIEKENQYIKFNALQSLFFSGLIIAVFLVISVLSSLPFIGKILSFILYNLAYFIFTIIWIILLVKSLKGEYFKLPLIGNFAEKYSKISIF